MSQDATQRAKRLMVGRYADWVKRFDVNEFIQNAPMIEKLYEEKQLALTSSIDLENKVSELRIQVHELQLRNQKLEIQVEENRRKSAFLFGLALLATILVGFGVNIVTSSNEWTGWVMVVSACILELIAFISRPKKDS